MSSNLVTVNRFTMCSSRSRARKARIQDESGWARRKAYPAPKAKPAQDVPVFLFGILLFRRVVPVHLQPALDQKVFLLPHAIRGGLAELLSSHQEFLVYLRHR